MWQFISLAYKIRSYFIMKFTFDLSNSRKHWCPCEAWVWFCILTLKAENTKTTHLTHLEPALNVNLFVHRRQNTLQKGGSDPFQYSKVFPWTAWTFGYLSNCGGAQCLPAATLILTTKTLFNGKASPSLAAVISSNTPPVSLLALCSVAVRALCV